MNKLLIEQLDAIYKHILDYEITDEVKEVLSLIDELQNKIEEL